MESTSDGNGRLVPVLINGTARKLLFDTGGLTTQLSWSAVKELDLSPQHRSVVIQDSGGRMSDQVVRTNEFVLGRQRGKDMLFMVNPDGALGRGQDRYDGLLSSDLLLGYDVDVDFGNNKLNFFSPDHCLGKVLYWNPPGVGIVPITVKARSLRVSVVVDGKTLEGLIDTGASNSTMSLFIANRIFGLGKDEGDSAIRFADPRLEGFVHTFSSISFGDVSIRNAKVVISSFKNGVEEMASRNYDRRAGAPDLIIGMNVLRHLHLYVAPKENRVYVGAASEAVQPQGNTPN
jgi:predicted aspartyl protease